MKNIEKITLGTEVYPIGYKVVTQDLESLNNDSYTITYPINSWYAFPKDQITMGSREDGGIWSSISLASAKNLERMMLEKHSKRVRIFKAALGEILYSDEDRIKTDRIKLLEEVFDEKVLEDIHLILEEALKKHNDSLEEALKRHKDSPRKDGGFVHPNKKY